jgi:cytochrome P450
VVTKKGTIVTIPKGTDIFSNMWFIHRDPEIWSNPDSFDHTRFLNKPNNVPAFHPFSMGLRACPGQRIAFSILELIVANMLLNFEVKPAEGFEPPHFDGNLMLPVTPMNMMLSFKERISE